MSSERIDKGGFRIRHHNHVGLFDASETDDGRTVEGYAVLESLFFNFRCRKGDMMRSTVKIDETEIYPLDAFFL